MYKIPYTYTNKSKIVFYLMILAYFLLRLILMIQIKAYKLEGYEVFLLPTIIYYLTIFIVLTAIFFGYKFFFTTYDENTITYHNILLKRSASIELDKIKYAVFSKNGVHFYKTDNPAPADKPEFTIPFFRLGIIDAVPINNFFERLIDRNTIRIEKQFKVLPGYSKPWTIVALVYAFLTFCVLIISMQLLYTVIILFQTFH